MDLSSQMLEGIARDVAPFGLSVADFEVMVRLRDSGSAGIRMSELAAHVLATKSRLTYRIDRLEELGYVCRESVESDRRGWVVHLTECGDALLSEALVRHFDGIRTRLVNRLEPDELSQLGDLISKVLVSRNGAGR